MSVAKIKRYLKLLEQEISELNTNITDPIKRN